jgi:hypothetical protein
MMKKYSQKDLESFPWLHLYAQGYEHSSASIMGTQQGLEALRDALDEAIRKGKAKAEVFVRDGEGYHVEITRTSYQGMEKEYLPYLYLLENIKTSP